MQVFCFHHFKYIVALSSDLRVCDEKSADRPGSPTFSACALMCGPESQALSGCSRLQGWLYAHGVLQEPSYFWGAAWLETSQYKCLQPTRQGQVPRLINQGRGLLVPLSRWQNKFPKMDNASICVPRVSSTCFWLLLEILQDQPASDPGSFKITASALGP